MQAHLNTIYESSFGSIVDFKCQTARVGSSLPEHVDSFSINFTRRGTFGYAAGRAAFDIHSGVILFEHAGTERVVTHRHLSTRDECTALEFTDRFYEELTEDWARTRADKQNPLISGLATRAPVLMPTTPRLEYLHASLLNAALGTDRSSLLKTDVLLMCLLEEIGNALGESRMKALPLNEKLKDRHLDMIDRARSFIIANFKRELSLREIARHAYLSVFHFSRLFKHFTSRSPYQYLIDVRLRHAALLLRHTSLPVTEICYDSGFNSFEHFITTFTQYYSTSPSKFRRQRQPA